MVARGKQTLKRLDTRTKLLLTVLFSILVFIVDSPPVAAVQTLFFLVMFLCAKIPSGEAVGKVFARYKFMLFLIALVVILQMAFGGGLKTGLMIACRIISLVIIFPLLTMTTQTGDIALSLTRLGFNYKTAFIITSAFNILPTFREDAGQLLDALKLRGVMLRGKNVFSRFGVYAKIALPMMIKTMRSASAVGLAMDARAFGAYRARTWRARTWRDRTGTSETKMSAVDFIALTAGAVYAAVAVTANYIIK